MKIEKKILPGYFDKILSGEKTFELRLADWECTPGDTLLLKEWDSSKKAYTVREVEKKVTYVIKTKDTKLFSPKEIEKYGFQVIAIQ